MLFIVAARIIEIGFADSGMAESALFVFFFRHFRGADRERRQQQRNTTEYCNGSKDLAHFKLLTGIRC